MTRFVSHSLRYSIAAGLFCVFLFAGSAVGESPSVKPVSLEFESRQDEPVFLTLKVQAPDSFNIKAEFEGFSGDRRISSKGDGQFLVEIAPLTVELGTLRGKIVITDADTGNDIIEPLPITGRIEPWIHAKPTRIFLGTIGHGEKFAVRKEHSLELRSETGDFAITSIEIPGIADATWTVDPSVGTTSEVHRVSVTFSPDAVGDGFPFGALATEPILIHTSHKDAPQLEIPVMGMLSINTSGRDYSEFLYNGHVRWEGPWATPNVAGANLATGLVFWCGLTAGLFAWQSGYRRMQTVNTIIAVAGFLLGCHFLALTYSRGGWIALGVGTFALLAGIRKPRFYPILLGATFAGAVLLLPAGLDRTTSTSQLNEDKSIKHRLLLWKGALQMIGEHPWTGVGNSNFGKAFQRDYQDAGQKATYTTAINDFLTLGAERGIIPLIVTTSGLLSIVAVGFWGGWRQRWPILTGASATILAFLVASCFSSIAFSWKNSALLIFPALTFLIAALILMSRQATSSYYLKIRATLIGTGSILLLVSTVTLTAIRVSLQDRPAQSTLKIGSVDTISISPRNAQERGTIIYISDREDESFAVPKHIIRPLASMGWHVLYVPGAKYPSDTAIDIRQLLNEIHEDNEVIVLAGRGAGAQAAVMSAEGNDQVCGIASRDLPKSGVLPRSLSESRRIPTLTPLNPFPEFRRENTVADSTTDLRTKRSIAEAVGTLIHHKGTGDNPTWVATINKLASERIPMESH